MDKMLQPCDIFFTRGTGRISRLIRKFTRSRGEQVTIANHVGLIADVGVGLNAWGVEALGTVKYHRLADQYKSGFEIAVFRPTNLDGDQRHAVHRKALGYINRKYGWLKLALHFADWTLGGRYLFRRIGRMDNYPICSYLVAHCFKMADKNFGVSADGASPDDIWDFCTGHPDKYSFVWQLGEMYKGGK